MHRRYSHEITVDRPLAEAIRLFTPKGEEAWVPGWMPEYVTPATGETREEMIFITRDGEETTYWTCLRWRPEDGHARYLRLTPDSRVAFVDVRCRTDGRDRTRVRVAYEIEALSEAGRAYLDAMTPETYRDMIEGWAQSIRTAIG